jgi:hypothetical protein
VVGTNILEYHAATIYTLKMEAVWSSKHWHHTASSPPLLCASENWTMNAKNKTRITAAEMRFMRQMAK